MRLSRALAPLLLLASAGCEAADDRAGSAPLADTLTELIEHAYDFDTPGAAERMAALYAEGEGVVSASGGSLTVSADSVRAGIDRFWELVGRNMRGARWIWTEVHVEPLGGEAAVLTGTWAIPHIAPDGLPHRIEGAWTAVFERIDGEWKIRHEHLSVPPDSPGMDGSGP